jgi:hypothetical protein
VKRKSLTWDKAILKANVAEEIVHRYLEEQGFIVYKPITEGAHAFDILAIKNKRKVMVADIKAKARRNYYPDTGINVKHYEVYKDIQTQHNLPVFLFFVDEYLMQIYGNWLSELSKPRKVVFKGKELLYPLFQKGIVYFPLEAMIMIETIPKETATLLIEYSSRSYEYEADSDSKTSFLLNN